MSIKKIYQTDSVRFDPEGTFIEQKKKGGGGGDIVVIACCCCGSQPEVEFRIEK